MPENSPAEILPDGYAGLMPAEAQRQAARMAQDAFAAVFRLSADSEATGRDAAFQELAGRCRNWCAAGIGEDGRALRRALLIGGLDQWGLAYAQAFGLTAIPALTALLGDLRTGLDAQEDARFQKFFAEVEAVEADAVDFKIELRRNIHIALWHAMGACDDGAAADRICRTLGSLLLALDARMPTLGWRLLADALATIQMALLADGSSGRLAQEGTERLFEALRQNLPVERYRAILAQATRATLAWQQARRAGPPAA
jgi:hypothetical protein